MVYVQGMLAPIAETQKDAFTAAARKAAPVFKQAGALAVVDAWGFDLPAGKHNDFRTAVKAEDGETVIFSYIVWPDKSAGETGMETAMQDPFFQSGEFASGMDMKRMIFGGFEPAFSVGAFVGVGEILDGFLCPVRHDQKQIYIDYAEKAWPLFFSNHGAAATYECAGVDVPDGEITSMPMAVMKKPDEMVMFTWMTWPTKEVRDEAAKVMFTDEKAIEEIGEMPYDGSRMIYGTFQIVSEL